MDRRKTDITLPSTERNPRLPNHVAIILDGNGRWAEQRGLPRLAGHQAGVESLRSVIKCLNEYQIKYVTVYAFSSENWSRPENEVNGLFSLIEEGLYEETLALHKNDVRILHIGRLKELPQSLQLAVNRAIILTKDNMGMSLVIALNYGGRLEIIDAVRNILNAKIPPQNINEKLFSGYLYTAGMPDVDLLIRTGGESRISNFLLWQTTQAQCYFTEIPWPDFNGKEAEKALLDYIQRRSKDRVALLNSDRE
jgi:undecaprenyl diphosphate synthase